MTRSQAERQAMDKYVDMWGNYAQEMKEFL